MTNKLKKTIISSVPYVFIGLFATKLGQAWRFTSGDELGTRILDLGDGCIRQPKNAEKAHVTFRIATNKYS